MNLIPQIKVTLIYLDEELDYIETLKPFEGKKWEARNKKITSLKKNIREQLSKNQNEKCAYCGLSLERTSNSEIEHIAPKGKLRNGTILNPEFMFTDKNLALACHYCNCILKKGTFDTIESKESVYENCTFKIVHPYFDNPDDHYAWVTSDKAILIKGKTPKGILSINLFTLNTIQQSEARAEECSTRYLRDILAKEYKELIKKAMEYH